MMIAGILALLAHARAGELVEYTEQLLASRTAAELAYRFELVAAVISVTDDAQEQRQLLKIARFESSFREDVGRCRKLGPEGEEGPFQNLARRPSEHREVCASLEGAAHVALERVHESIAACHSLPPEDRLAVYTRGRCSSDLGRRMSRARYAP